MNADGVHQAHLKLNLRQKTITSSIHDEYLPQLTFDQFLKSPVFEGDFCRLLNVDRNKLVDSILEIIKNQDLLRELRDSFLKDIQNK